MLNQSVPVTPTSASPLSAETIAEPLPLPQQPLYEENSPMEEVRVIPDFLPPPEELAFCGEEVGE